MNTTPHPHARWPPGAAVDAAAADYRTFATRLIALTPPTVPTLEETLETGGLPDPVTQLLVEVLRLVPEAQHASLAVASARTRRTTAVTHPAARQATLAQFHSGQGPTTMAMRTRQSHTAPDLRDGHRVDRLLARLAGSGIVAATAIPIGSPTGPVTVLTLYSQTPTTFTAGTRLDDVCLALVDLALTGILEHRRTRNLTYALESNRRIGVAIGILVNQQRIKPEQAFEQLSTISQLLNRALSDIADEVTHTGQLPDTPTASIT